MEERRAQDGGKEPWGNLPLDEHHAHLLLEFDEQALSLSSLIEAVERAAAKVMDVHSLPGASPHVKAVLVTIDTQDIRPVVLRLARYPLLRLEGYNARAGRSTP